MDDLLVIKIHLFMKTGVVPGRRFTRIARGTGWSGNPGKLDSVGRSPAGRPHRERGRPENDPGSRGIREWGGPGRRGPSGNPGSRRSLKSSAVDDLSLEAEDVLTSSGAEDLSSLQQLMLEDFFQTHCTFLTKYIVISCIDVDLI
ncbi:hypothetical protein L6452_28280 [Arctium lappa]|uniref:Uncharacterized protein n=1 Tax=Arctium lappa TaxID=4217 RepID=A0ACB8ZYU5_ARCLA|nr:hypothetical protein L6452_28280 [Arctium lappa]